MQPSMCASQLVCAVNVCLEGIILVRVPACIQVLAYVHMFVLVCALMH